MKTEIIDSVEEQITKLEYLAETEDKPGLSNFLLDISRKLYIIKNNIQSIQEINDEKTIS